MGEKRWERKYLGYLHKICNLLISKEEIYI